MGQLAVPAEQLGSGAASSTEQLPKVLRDILTKARTSWLRNQEVVDLLTNYRSYRFRVSKEPPQKPPGVRNLLNCPVQALLPAVGLAHDADLNRFPWASRNTFTPMSMVSECGYGFVKGFKIYYICLRRWLVVSLQSEDGSLL